ncbi:MAG: redox-regulated ATPase YchF [Oscillospiraceae bacterium]|nr:redox-regulated ATPase YchF [Oscillospiraceae bacterium]
MKIGLIGLNQTGKTTLFELLSGRSGGGGSGGGGSGGGVSSGSSGSRGSSGGSGGTGIGGGDRKSASIGMGQVPDERVDILSAMYRPKKTTYAKIEFTDVAGFTASGDGGNAGAARFLNDVRPCDALIHVLRAFDSETVAHDLGDVDPARDLEAVEMEMLFADMEMLERRIGRLKAGKKISKDQTAEIGLLERCYAQLENGGAMSDMDMTEEELAVMQGYAFLTEKPRLAVVNLDERQWKAGDYHHRDELLALCAKLNMPLILLCVEMELEISRLADDDKKLFMDDLGIAQPGIAVLASAMYGLLGQISFFTVGEDEVRAWTIDKGSSARISAGKIHSDIERGFIRAEVVKYENLVELGSMAKVKEQGLFRLEGKEYIVADGDIISFRFNV